MHRSNDGKMKKMEFMTIDIKEIFRNYVKRNNNQPGLNSSAVLVPIYYRDGWPFILFTQRSNQVIHHKGQICFPGGKQEENDCDLLHTALREAEEEIGLHSSDTEIVGELDDHITTSSRYVISPYIALIPYPYQFVINTAEIQQLFSVPMYSLLNNHNWGNGLNDLNRGSHTD